MRSPARVVAAFVLAAVLVYEVAWYGRAALVALGLVALLLVVCTSLALAGGLVWDRHVLRGASRSRSSAPGVMPDNVVNVHFGGATGELARQLRDRAQRTDDDELRIRLQQQLTAISHGGWVFELPPLPLTDRRRGGES